MKRFVLCVASKGGVGKSCCAQLFIGLARQAGRRVSAWDLDRGTGSLAWFYRDRDPEAGVGVEDIRDEDTAGLWLDAVYGDADDVLLDVPGGALDNLVRSLEGGAPSLVAAVKGAGREVVVASLIGVKPDQSGAPQEAIELFGSSGVRHVVVKNGLFGDEDAFIVYDGLRDEKGELLDLYAGITDDEGKPLEYGNTARVVAAAGGEVVYLPKFSDTKTDVILAIRRLSYTQGAESLDLLGRRRMFNIRYWLTAVETALAGTWLCPKGDVPLEVPSPKAGRRAAVTAVAS